MDPTTVITTAIASALSKLGESVVKEAYDKLKATIIRKYGVNSELGNAVESLERKPRSDGRKQTLKEEIAAAKADRDPQIVELAQSLFDELNDLEVHSGGSSISQQASGTAIQIGGQVTRSIVAIITEGIDRSEFSHARSEDYNERGRQRVRAYGERMARNREWDWHALGQAIEYYVDAVRYDSQNQHPWINLAYVYHLIGMRRKALECLDRALELATPGPNYPGRHYKQVKAAVESNSYISGGTVTRPTIPDWFRERYERFLE